MGYGQNKRSLITKTDKADNKNKIHFYITDVYSHIIDDDRRINTQRFEEQFYQSKAAPVTEEMQDETASQTDQEMLRGLLANPEMEALLKSLAENL